MLLQYSYFNVWRNVTKSFPPLQNPAYSESFTQTIPYSFTQTNLVSCPEVLIVHPPHTNLSGILYTFFCSLSFLRAYLHGCFLHGLYRTEGDFENQNRWHFLQLESMKLYSPPSRWFAHFSHANRWSVGSLLNLHSWVPPWNFFCSSAIQGTVKNDIKYAGRVAKALLIEVNLPPLRNVAPSSGLCLKHYTRITTASHNDLNKRGPKGSVRHVVDSETKLHLKFSCCWGLNLLKK